MKVHTDFDRFLLDRGCSLQSLEISELALTWVDALQAAELAMDCRVPILGGDVYYRSGSVIEPAYANWHVDRKDGENADAFIRRSYEETNRYLKALPKPTSKEYLIVLVTG